MLTHRVIWFAILPAAAFNLLHTEKEKESKIFLGYRKFELFRDQQRRRRWRRRHLLPQSRAHVNILLLLFFFSLLGVRSSCVCTHVDKPFVWVRSLREFLLPPHHMSSHTHTQTRTDTERPIEKPSNAARHTRNPYTGTRRHIHTLISPAVTGVLWRGIVLCALNCLEDGKSSTQSFVLCP